MEIVPENIQVTPNSIAIVGWEDGGPGQVHSWLEKATGYHIACFVNPSNEPPHVNIEYERNRREAKNFNYPAKDSFKGQPLVTSLNWADVLLNLGINKVLVMTNDNRERLKNIELAKEKGLEFISAIHPSALILEDALIHDNVIIYARATVGYRAEVHSGAVLNTNAQIDHHNVLYKCVRIDPGVVTAGNVTLHECATVHTGAVIINKIRVGADAVIGAGSVVIRDVPDKATVIGVPGKEMKKEEN